MLHHPNNTFLSVIYSFLQHTFKPKQQTHGCQQHNTQNYYYYCCKKKVTNLLVIKFLLRGLLPFFYANISNLYVNKEIY